MPFKDEINRSREAEASTILGFNQNHSKWRRTLNLRKFGVVPPNPCFCSICQKPIFGRKIMTDHNHTTGTFRGWLCHYCNTSLGWLEQYSEQAKKYLESSL